jgi:hypothetical protein
MDFIGLSLSGFFVMAVSGHFRLFGHHKIPSFRYVLLRTAGKSKCEKQDCYQPKPYKFPGNHAGSLIIT